MIVATVAGTYRLNDGGLDRSDDLDHRHTRRVYSGKSANANIASGTARSSRVVVAAPMWTSCPMYNAATCRPGPGGCDRTEDEDVAVAPGKRLPMVDVQAPGQQGP